MEAPGWSTRAAARLDERSTERAYSVAEALRPTWLGACALALATYSQIGELGYHRDLPGELHLAAGDLVLAFEFAILFEAAVLITVALVVAAVWEGVRSWRLAIDHGFVLFVRCVAASVWWFFNTRDARWISGAMAVLWLAGWQLPQLWDGPGGEIVVAVATIPPFLVVCSYASHTTWGHAPSAFTVVVYLVMIGFTTQMVADAGELRSPLFLLGLACSLVALVAEIRGSWQSWRGNRWG